jgi:hypothetical protein
MIPLRSPQPLKVIPDRTPQIQVREGNGLEH